MCGPRGELTVGPSPVPTLTYETLRAQYAILRTIGQGGCAQVKLAQHRLTGAEVAIKVLRKGRKQAFPARSEVEIMKRMNHPNIVSLLQVIETKESIFLILELADGRELLDWIQQVGCLQEGVARKIFKQIVHAMCYCHDLGIVHRDLKPDNIMVDATGKVKIIDFGLGTLVRPGKKLSGFCGALRFGAPECFLHQPYDGTKVDTWNMGVLLYFMVTGTLPFEGTTFQELGSQVLLGRYDVPSYLSQELQDIIRCLLTVNPTERPTLKDIMEHPWLRQGDEGSPNHWDDMDPRSLDPAIMAAMVDMGFDTSDIWKSLLYRLFNEPMATYSLLKRQARQQDDFISQAESVQPGLTPFPTPTDPADFPGYQKRAADKPAFQVLASSKSDSLEDSYQVGKRLKRSAILPVFPHHCLEKRTPILDVVKVPTETQHSGTADTIQGVCRVWKRWTKRIRANLLQLCCCLPPKRKRVVPQREGLQEETEALLLKGPTLFAIIMLRTTLFAIIMLRTTSFPIIMLRTTPFPIIMLRTTPFPIIMPRTKL
ncbi:sperm motility kinase 4A-like [Acomys russatus]|uniref:sperm motility kinase 4A-like n=1 Tax=Acomys russatus TaxID=60746 RepID=UPI0021E1C9F8|nr:sperm motility kinase 4A-like [Acomys russatus]